MRPCSIAGRVSAPGSRTTATTCARASASAMRRWNGTRTKRDPDLLYRGTPLLSALEWATQNPDQLGVLDRGLSRCVGRGQGQGRGDRRGKGAASARMSVASRSRFFPSWPRAPPPPRSWHFWRSARRMQNERRAVAATDRGARALRRRARRSRPGAWWTTIRSSPSPSRPRRSPAEPVGHAGIRRPRRHDRGTQAVGARRSRRASAVPIPAGDALAIAMSPDGSLLAVGRAEREHRPHRHRDAPARRAEPARPQRRGRGPGFLAEQAAARLRGRRRQAPALEPRQGAEQPRGLGFERRVCGACASVPTARRSPRPARMGRSGSGMSRRGPPSAAR